MAKEEEIVMSHRDIFADDIEWGQGSEAGIAYTRFLLEENNPKGPMIVMSKFDPGTRVPPHTHPTNYFEYIIEGEQTVGKVTFRKGDVRLVTANTGYGPITVGPEGCFVIIVFQEAENGIMIPKGAAAEEAVA
jgi:quercetin dioxygenase-like cupin family protein